MANKHAHEPYTNLLRLMKARKIKITQAAAYVGVNRDTFVAKAKGDRDFFLQEAVKLSELLNEDIGYLFDLEINRLNQVLDLLNNGKTVAVTKEEWKQL